MIRIKERSDPPTINTKYVKQNLPVEITPIYKLAENKTYRYISKKEADGYHSSNTEVGWVTENHDLDMFSYVWREMGVDDGQIMQDDKPKNSPLPPPKDFSFTAYYGDPTGFDLWCHKI